MAELTPETVFYAVLVTLLAGFIKGAVGFAMPLVMLSGLTVLLEPQLAVAALIFPVMVSNGLQTFRTGLAPAVDAVRSAWRYVLIACVAILIFAQFVPHIEPRLFYLVLGIPVVLLTFAQLVGYRPYIPPVHRGWAEWVIALGSGIMGGLAGTWGPLTILYLMAIETPKARQVIIQGVIYGMASVMLLIAHLGSGVMNAVTVPFSLGLVVPAAIGMWLGFKVQDRLDQERFRKAVLIVLVISGLNLLRRGLFG